MNRQEEIKIYYDIEVKKFEKENAEIIEFTGEIPDYILSDIMEEVTKLVDRPVNYPEHY